jgi:hypothetical protein
MIGTDIGQNSQKTDRRKKSHPFSVAAIHAQIITPYSEDNPNGEISTNDVVYVEDAQPPEIGAYSIQNSPNPSLSFQGLDDDNSRIPPDPQGAVGPNHVMTMLNTQVRIQDRTGSTLDTKSLFNWWTNAGSVSGVFDPRIAYDPYANRWIATVCANANSTNSALLVAVSQTSDPTGTNWYFRKIAADGTGTYWADFPNVGFNKKWIVVSLNMPRMNTNRANHTRFVVFDKTNFYANGTTHTTITNAASLMSTIVPAQTYDNTTEDLYCLQSWSTLLDGVGIAKATRMRLSKIIGSPSSPAYSTSASLAQFPPWAHTPPGENDFAPQAGTANKIQVNDARIQKVVYRNGFIWGVNTVFFPYYALTSCGIQWVQLYPTGAIRQRGLIQGSGEFYGFPSIAVNRFDDVLIGYSSFQADVYARGSFSFRATSDKINSMRLETVLKAGEGPYVKRSTGTKNRWGDYSATVVDPVNDTDFWTLQEYAATPVSPGTNNNNGRWGVWWGKITPEIPANDNFAAALEIVGAQGSTNGTLFRSTRETNEPSHAGNPGDRSVWYKWTAPVNGTVQITVSGGTLDTLLGIYTGTAVGSLSLVTSNDDTSASLKSSAVTFAAVAGTTYRIAVDAKGFLNELGDRFTLTWNQPTAPFFILDPLDKHILAGHTLVLLSEAIANPTPTYQWWSNSIPIANANFANYTNQNHGVPATNILATNYFSVIASNSLGSATSLLSRVIIYPSATAVLDGQSYLTNDSFRFVVTGIPGYSYIVQASADLTNWTSIETNISSFTNNTPATNFPYRFFRTIY